MKIEKVTRGDVIIEGRGEGIEVKKVTEFACSSFGTHINDRYCYDRGSDVRVRQSRKDEAEKYFEDQMMDDWSRENSSERV